MIQHGQHEVTLAMRDRQVITNISRGRHTLYEGLGIKFAAIVYIKSEYGNEVWKEVYDYVKAHPQIVPFINQDPDIVISISEKSGKERALKGDTSSYFNTGVIPTNNTGFEIKFYTMAKHYFGWQHVFGSTALGVVQSANNAYTFLHNSARTSLYSVLNSWDILKSDINSCSTLTNSASLSGKTTAGTTELQVFRCNGWSDPLPDSKLQYAVITESGEPIRHYIPYRDPNTGEMELLDLVTATFATRVGAFTEIIEDKQ